MGDAASQLADPRGHPSRLRGLPDLRRSEGASATLHQQGGQLRVPIELHPPRPVGDRLRDARGRHPADNTAEQESDTGAAGRFSGRIVSDRFDRPIIDSKCVVSVICTQMEGR